jgi:hypothetical protein
LRAAILSSFPLDGKTSLLFHEITFGCARLYGRRAGAVGAAAHEKIAGCLKELPPMQ